MKAKSIFRYAFVAAMTAGICIFRAPTGWSQDVVPPAPTAAADVEVLPSGPVHEAFAEVVTDPKPAIIVPKRPPDPIEEVAPEFALAEEGAIWISGYWAWDDEREDFFWVSGVSRVPPPGMRWVGGYWSEVPGGWQWTRGFWVSEEKAEIRYYDPPPASLEVGPASPSPGDDYFWVNGNWSYYDTGYRWRPGFWCRYRPDWVWVPARYIWTPSGCIYLDGYWDHRLTRRGCLYAPVYFTSPIYTRPGYYYRPWCAINTSNLFIHLWVRPNYCHFYYGNFYGSRYADWGFTPWCQYRPWRNCYDPHLAQLQCHYRRQGIDYIGRLDGWHRHYNNHSDVRPPRTWNDQVRLASQGKLEGEHAHNHLAVDLKEAAKRDALPVKLARLDENAQKKMTDVARHTREVSKQRVKTEKLDPALLAGAEKGPELKLPEGVKNAAKLPRDGGLAGKGENRAGAGAKVRKDVKLSLPPAAGIAGNRGRQGPPKINDKPASINPGIINAGKAGEVATQPDQKRPEVKLPRGVGGEASVKKNDVPVRQDAPRRNPLPNLEGNKSRGPAAGGGAAGNASSGNPFPKKVEATPRVTPQVTPKIDVPRGNKPPKLDGPNPSPRVTPRNEGGGAPRGFERKAGFEASPRANVERSPTVRNVPQSAPRAVQPKFSQPSNPQPRVNVQPQGRSNPQPQPRMNFSPAPKVNSSPAPRMSSPPSFRSGGSGGAVGGGGGGRASAPSFSPQPRSGPPGGGGGRSGGSDRPRKK